MIQTKLFKKIWAETMNNVIFLTDISFTSTELFSKLIEFMKKINIFWKTWKNISYNLQKNIWEIDTNIYVQMKDFEFKKADKLLFWRKKIILIKFQNSVIYWLYNQETDLIIISINIDINKKRNEISFKKSSLTEIKNLLTDQLFFELSAVISAEISPTSNLLAVRIILTKSALMILHCSFCRAVRAALKNINLSNLMISNLVF